MVQGSIIFTARPTAEQDAPAPSKINAYTRAVASMSRVQTRWISIAANVALWAVIIRFAVRAF